MQQNIKDIILIVMQTKFTVLENLYVADAYKITDSIAVIIIGYINSTKFFFISFVALFFLYENAVEIILQTVKYNTLQIIHKITSAVRLCL